LKQRSAEWLEARRHRITASQAYSILTYGKKERSPTQWAQKIRPRKFAGNANTDPGNKWEEVSRRKLEKDLGATVETVGLVYRPAISWLAASPDGIIWDSARGNILVEIKYPISGKTGPVNLSKLKYMVQENGSFLLKQNSLYYRQLQINMALTGCKNAYFCLFSSHLKENVIFEVDFNKQYTDDVISTLKLIYFTHILPCFVNSHPVTRNDDVQ